MKGIILSTTLLLPILMYYLQENIRSLRKVFHVMALISLLLFVNIAGFAIYQIIRDGKVYSMDIHGLFLNPFFLLTASYLAIYLIFILLLGIRKGLFTA